MAALIRLDWSNPEICLCFIFRAFPSFVKNDRDVDCALTHTLTLKHQHRTHTPPHTHTHTPTQPHTHTHLHIYTHTCTFLGTTDHTGFLPTQAHGAVSRD